MVGRCWKTTFHLGRPIFRGYVSFREGTCPCMFLSHRNMIIQEHSPPPKDPSHSKTPTPSFCPHPLLSNFPLFFVVSGRCLCRISPDGRRQEGLSDWQHLRSVPLFRGARGLLSNKWGMCQKIRQLQIHVCWF